MTDPFTITVPGPLGENLGQNAHVHYYVKAKATRDARTNWTVAAIIDTQDIELPYDRVRLTFRAYLKHKKGPIGVVGYRPRDLDNLVAAMKPAVDGLVDAGLVEDDDKTRVRYGDHDITWVDSFAEERVEILVEPL